MTDKKNKGEPTLAWQRLLKGFSKSIMENVPPVDIAELENLKRIREGLIEKNIAALEAERKQRAEDAQRALREQAIAQAAAAERASWSPFRTKFESLCKDVEKSGQPVQVNNALWQRIVTVSNEIANQSAEDKQIALEWMLNRIEPKLAVPKDKLKELKRKFS